MSTPASWRCLTRHGDHYKIDDTPYLLMRRERTIAPRYYKIDWVAINPKSPNADAVRLVFATLAEADEFWFNHRSVQ